MATKIQLRGSTASEWTTANPILAHREVGIETDTKKFKFGDGSTAWNALAYVATGVGGGAWGSITGTLSDQTDLQAALDDIATDLSDHITDTVGAHAASAISNTPAGTIAAITVQAALNELDSEKQASLGFTPENVANKKTDFSVIDNTGYPSTQAVQDRINAALAGQKWKSPGARVATTVAGTLASSFENGDTIDGVVLATGDRILIKNQATQSENGIYTVNASGAPTRSTDADSATELEAATITVTEGTSNADTTWIQITDGVTLGSSNIVWTQFGSSAPDASSSVKGIAKLYTATGSNTDGAMDQNSVTNALALKVAKAGDTMSGNLAMGGNKVTGLAAATANGEAVRFEEALTLDTEELELALVTTFQSLSQR